MRCGVMEDKFMDTDHRPVADRQRGSKRGARKKDRLRWFCKPQVLKAVFEVARLGYELLRFLLQY